MDNRWFKEDRKLPKGEQAEAFSTTEEALKNSTLISRLLKGICEDEIDGTYRVEEDHLSTFYERAIIASASRRKAFKEIIKLLP